MPSVIKLISSSLKKLVLYEISALYNVPKKQNVFDFLLFSMNMTFVPFKLYWEKYEDYYVNLVVFPVQRSLTTLFALISVANRLFSVGGWSF